MSKNSSSLFVTIVVVAIGALFAFAGSQGSSEFQGIPIFAIGVAIAFLFQWIAYIPAYLKKTEKFYDITGTITYLTVILVSVLLSPSIDARSILLTSIIGIWAIRLGYFLFTRIHRAGEDKRFKEIKQSYSRFLMTWTLQGLWVTFSLAAALAAITSKVRVALDVFAYLGLAIWVVGFAIEVIADWQKSKFRSVPENKTKFINFGLWSWSRHPNYFGEILLWVGVAVISLPILRGWQWFMLISPVFVTLLLTKLSGIPMLEKSSDERWGGQDDYEQYKTQTSILIPLPPKNN